MDDHIKAVAIALWQEVKKDLPFFGICGFFVGWLMVVQFRLKEIGAAPNESWADVLFSDFISFNAFGLIFVGLLGLGSLITCLHALKISWPHLERSVAHLEVRLAQLASSIISFTIGLSLFSSAHALFTITAQGVVLAFVIALFDGLIVVGFMSAALVARRPPPFDRWYVGSGMFAASLAAITWFVFYGTK
jgi:hypothetical protein